MDEPHKDVRATHGANAPSPDQREQPEQPEHPEHPEHQERLENLADRPLTQPHPDRLSPDDPAYAQIIQAHSEALRAGADTYIDPRSGYTVLTAAYLARRGHCCDSGCRHCPYVR